MVFFGAGDTTQTLSLSGRTIVQSNVSLTTVLISGFNSKVWSGCALLEVFVDPAATILYQFIRSLLGVCSLDRAHDAGTAVDTACIVYWVRQKSPRSE